MHIHARPRMHMRMRMHMHMRISHAHCTRALHMRVPGAAPGDGRLVRRPCLLRGERGAAQVCRPRRVARRRVRRACVPPLWAAHRAAFGPAPWRAGAIGCARSNPCMRTHTCTVIFLSACGVPMPCAQRPLGPLLPLRRHANCSRWVEARYRVCANLGEAEAGDFNVMLRDGTWVAQRFTSLQPAGSLEGAFLHLQRWKSVFKKMRYGSAQVRACVLRAWCVHGICMGSALGMHGVSPACDLDAMRTDAAAARPLHLQHHHARLHAARLRLLRRAGRRRLE